MSLVNRMLSLKGVICRSQKMAQCSARVSCDWLNQGDRAGQLAHRCTHVVAISAEAWRSQPHDYQPAKRDKGSVKT